MPGQEKTGTKEGRQSSSYIVPGTRGSLVSLPRAWLADGPGILVQPQRDSCWARWRQPTKVGFLKILHKYEITFVLPFVQLLGKEICPAPLSNLHLKVTNIAPVSEGYRVSCEYVAHKEGVLHEEMVLCSETNHSASIKVVVQARVMDRHHGTPMLLEGVKCIGAEVEYDSEQSEWQGFD
ncbi:UPF0687 protein C20orf27 homolog isoform X1 [Crotalus tigris]|uniref:UPF0687 protein C20orf27 homolog isoform X1 n=1 Tax=Crotalus tigris TaxID=88082 RepID=UPI00192F6B1A|nr:UPF0687 protein C20orf27 homolog isoform X1 [Crotalus tigris]